ncbi:MAG TPA: zinc-binding alcohol dehydrogenase [Microvirga sp.]|jgi:threonine dehydrogenase-like Zn-dependent dehydrogenase
MKRENPEGSVNGSGSHRAEHALWYVTRGQAELRPVVLSEPGPGEARVRTLWTALSRGTERLVFEGRVSLSESERMRAPFQEGEFPYPVKYGYCAVGVVEAGPDTLLGRTVFALHPHQSRFVAPVSMLNPVPEGVPARRAVLAANMETALNALWDSGAGPGDRILVVGAGVVGCLVASLAARLPGAEVTLVDVDLSRRVLAERLGCGFAKPLDAPGEADVVFHASASGGGLACALACAGREATIVEMSWYGDQMVPAPLGLDFHSRRLKLVSSQVGEVSPSRRPRWSYGRRMEKALSLLADERLDALITDEIPFAALPEALPRLFARGAPGLTAAIRYP